MNTDVTRRQFLGYTFLAGAGLAIAPGCAVNPVTGKNQLMMISRENEIDIDRQQSPHQFSADYGVCQDGQLNNYIDTQGRKLAAHTHRKNMPYSFRCVNATYVNAYAFPGGSIAVTRGILLKLENEAELAALLGHELGHVNARHSAEQVTKGSIAGLLVKGVSAVINSHNSQMGALAEQLGMLGQGALLSYYSRDNEREADALGNEYMVKTGYSTEGFVGLMDILNDLHKGSESSVSILFATHPMSSERYETALQNSRKKYQYSKDFPVYRDRYMDMTQRLRAKKEAIEAMQDSDALLQQKKFKEAESALKNAIKCCEDDYTAHLMLAKCMLAQERFSDAMEYAKNASRLYPEEPQSYQVAGMADLNLKNYETAYDNFTRNAELLPGNPVMFFFRGYALDKMGRKTTAAPLYKSYLEQVQQGDYAAYAYRRLKEWGYISG
ncbi:MAG: M48 family metalloprotease [Thermodesulfobacteriota bacterium]|nr:M48 family metalloprotease [Thermodesulfobacteriota bacterium]